MKRSIDVEVRKQKGIRGVITGYVASVGPIEAYGTTEEGAVEGVEELVRQALGRLDQGPLTGQVYGNWYVVFPTAQGWGTWCDVYSGQNYYTENGCDSRDEAERSIIRHLALQSWTFEAASDEEYVLGVPKLTERERKEVLAQLRWYREMKRLVGKGYTDHEARQIIGGFMTETAEGPHA
jgi:hypothetical protein